MDWEFLIQQVDDIETKWTIITSEEIQTKEQANAWMEDFMTTATIAFDVYAKTQSTPNPPPGLVTRIQNLVKRILTHIQSYAQTLKSYGLETYTITAGVPPSVSLTFRA